MRCLLVIFGVHGVMLGHRIDKLCLYSTLTTICGQLSKDETFRFEMAKTLKRCEWNHRLVLRSIRRTLVMGFDLPLNDQRDERH